MQSNFFLNHVKRVSDRLSMYFLQNKLVMLPKLQKTLLSININFSYMYREQHCQDAKSDIHIVSIYLLHPNWILTSLFMWSTDLELD